MVLLLFVGSSTLAQGNFQNLDFESANIPPNPGVFIPFSNGLPNWTGSLGPYSATEVLYNGISGGFADISIIDRNSTFYSNSVIEGNYTVAISAGFAGMSFVPTSIAQTGLIPATAHSLIFDAEPFSGSISALHITFNGQDVPLVQTGADANFEIFAADITLFSGQTGELKFIENPISSIVATTVLLDDIQFSATTIPEPSVLCLSTLGGLLLAVRPLRQTRL